MQKLVADEYKQIKVTDRDERRQAVLETLDDNFADGVPSTTNSRGASSAN